jgi:hypothetical protein
MVFHTFKSIGGVTVTGTVTAWNTGLGTGIVELSVFALVSLIFNAFVGGGVKGVALETGATDVGIAQLTSHLGTVCT